MLFKLVYNHFWDYEDGRYFVETEIIFSAQNVNMNSGFWMFVWLHHFSHLCQDKKKIWT